MSVNQPGPRKGLLDLFKRGLPDFRSQSKRQNAPDFDVNRLAKEMGVTKACVYKWMRPNKDDSIPYTKAIQIIKMSEEQCADDLDLEPITFEEIKRFIS